MRSPQTAVYVISVAAELAGVHPQTLRICERKGLVDPGRTRGGSRRYSEADIALLRRIQELTNDGLNLAVVKRVLRDAGVPFTINPRLVRGLDYYNLTVFEWVTDRLGAQGTVCAGGRYDGLVEQLGGKATPACGFAMGVERLIALIKESGGEPAAPAPDVYLVHQGDAASRMAFRVAEGLRDQGINVLQHCGGGSFKSQMKKADGSGATFAVIIGDDEAMTGEAQLKPLREEGSAQLKLKIDDLAEAIIGQLIDLDEEE